MKVAPIKILILFLLLAFLSHPKITEAKGIKSFIDSLIDLKNSQFQKLMKVRENKAQKEQKLNQLDEEIKTAEAQISKAEQSIVQVETELQRTKADIKIYENQIAELENRAAPLKEKLQKILPVFHYLSLQSPIKKILGASSISALADELQSYKQLSLGLRKPLEQLNSSRRELEKLRGGLLALQENYSELKTRKIVQKNGLESEKKYKEKLTVKTQIEIERLKTEEADLAKREQEVEKEISQYLETYKSGGNFIGRKVSRGEIIGYQGDSGFSTGSHLHFTVFTDNNLKKHHNPDKHLKNSHLIYPLDDWRLTQGYGMTTLAKRGAYGGGPHNGIDIASFPGAPVKAAADGAIIMDKYFGSYGNVIIIDHGDNLYTLYGHLAK